MKFMTMAKAGLGVIKGHFASIKGPLFVTLATNNSCQSHCKYCKIPKRQQRDMTTEEIFRLIDEISALGTLRLGIWGGEPLLRHDIVDIVRHAHEKGLYVTLDSNGYLLPEKREILDYLDHMILSIDGPEEAHDANREPGSWKKVMAAMDCRRPDKALWTITVMTKNNIDTASLDWMLTQAEERNFIPTFQVLHHSEHFGINDPLRPEPEEYRKALRYLLDEKKKGRPVGNSVLCLENLINWPDYNKNTLPQAGKGWKHCWGGKFMVNVDPNGDLYPCSLLIGDVPAPNFLELGFAEAYRRITPPPCQSCLATCFTEYNLLLSLDPRTILSWVLAMGKK
ncbi:radical SAM protein [bacterium]|nr:radical SAM protein [bacterium]